MADGETTNFLDLLQRPLSDFPDRPNLPGAKYFYGKLVSVEAGASEQKETPMLLFKVKLTDPGQDVPKEALDKIANLGFTLADYDVGARFYLTRGAMVFLHRFLTSLGFGEGVTFIEALRLNPTTGEPTDDTQDLIRGMDVMVKTPPADDQGRVFLNNVSSEGSIVGTKRP